jgi:hypothetical protein
MNKLYFGVCPYGTIADVFINTLAGWSDKWLQPCTPDINSTGHLIHNKHQQYVIDLSNNNPMSFRDIDWTTRLTDIEKVLDKAGDKNVWIGSFNPDQAALIKNYFQERATTIGITYTPTHRDIILENVVTYYGVNSIENKERQWIEFQKKYFLNKNKFDYMVPISFEPTADHTIDIADFFNPENYIRFLEYLDGPRNEDQLDYYFTWFYRTKERINASFKNTRVR